MATVRSAQSCNQALSPSHRRALSERFKKRAKSDAGLEHLKGLTNLQSLYLDGTKITDSGLVHLKGLPNLDNLWLPKQITDSGLVHLKGMTNLQELRLVKHQITDAGVAELQDLLPAHWLR